MDPVRLIGPRVAWFEQAIAHADLEGEEDKTLFVQLTAFELWLVQYGLYWLSLIYGAHSVASAVEKLHDLIKAQNFCDCPNCVAEREEEAG